MRAVLVLFVLALTISACSEKSSKDVSNSGTGPSNPDGPVAGAGAGQSIKSRVFQQITAFKDATCGLQTDGTISCWGPTDIRVANWEKSPLRFTTISGNCGLTSEHGLYCMDFNHSPTWMARALAVFTTSSGYTCWVNEDHAPACQYGSQQFPAGLKVKQVYSDDQSFACYIGMDDVLNCTAPLPAKLTGLKVKQIQMRNSQICALTFSDEVKCWGRNSSDTQPNTYAFSKPVRSIILGQSLCAIVGDSVGQCVGESSFGRQPILTPFGGEKLAQISGNGCALTADHRTICRPPESRFASANPYYPGPSGFGKITDFVISRSFGCRLNDAGKVSCFIIDQHEFSNFTSKPWDIEKDGPMQSIAADHYFACGVKMDGTSVCRGEFPAELNGVKDLKKMWITNGSVCTLTKADQFTCTGAIASYIPAGGITGVRKTAFGSRSFCVVTQDQKATCYGDPSGTPHIDESEPALGVTVVNFGDTIRSDGYCIIHLSGQTCYPVTPGNPTISPFADLSVQILDIHNSPRQGEADCALTSAGDLLCKNYYNGWVILN